MPVTEVVFYQEDDRSVPVLDWLLELRQRNDRAFRKCFELIRLLEEFGHELRRPRANMLRDGVYELRARVGKVNYRILYGFIGKNVALLACGLTKEKAVPDKEIDLAVARIKKYKGAPTIHGFHYDEELDDSHG